MLAFLPIINSCGSEQGQDYFYSVDVVNNTSASITVRYDWEYLFWTSQWTGEATIPWNSSKIIEWSSANRGSEQIEVEYQGKKKRYTVSQLGTVQVSVQDFP